MPLAIEPLHPAYAADRACVNTTKQALDICDRLDPQRTGALGVALDVYHIWWDPELLPQIARAGKDRLLAFHVCDWLVPTKDILNDRGMMGDGVIDIRSVRAAVEAQGFAGYSEIEIFSNDWWSRPMDEVLQDLHRAASVGGLETRCCVVPANAGTHNHRALQVKRSRQPPSCHQDCRGVWVPAFAGTTTGRIGAPQSSRLRIISSIAASS